MARTQDSTTLAGRLATFLPRDTVEERARRLRVVKRRRKVDIYALVWALVLGFQVGSERTLEALRTAYQRAAGHSLARSAFHDRLTPALVKLLRDLAQSAISTLWGGGSANVGYLAGFEELLAIDATVLRLHDLLSRQYPACRTNHTQAAAKLHMVMSVVDGSPRRVKLTPERTSDSTPWRRVGQWARGKLLLFDLGYYSFHLFDRIDANGGFFLSRLKRNGNPRIVATNRQWRGRSIDVVGKRLQEVLGSLERRVLDVQVQVHFKRRVYKGKCSGASRTFRLVAIRNRETGGYHCYITNVVPDDLSAEDVTRTYALRWQVELLFKAMRSHGHFGQIPSRKRAVVECLVWASVLATAASQTLHRLIRDAVARDRHLPLLRWASLLGRVASDVLRLVTGAAGEAMDQELRALLIREAPDPNRKRADRALGPVLQPIPA